MRKKVSAHKEVIKLLQGDMAEKSCRPAFSLSFHSLIVAQQVFCFLYRSFLRTIISVSEVAISIT